MTGIIATKISDVGIVPLDYFSIGHICMGIGIFLAFHLIYSWAWNTKPVKTPTNHLFLLLALTFVVGIGWEFFENYTLLEIGEKFADRVDSVQNIVSDMFFLTLGGGLMVFLSKFLKEKFSSDYPQLGVSIFSFFLLAYFVMRYLTWN